MDGVTLSMGVTGSKLEKVLGDQFPEGERYFGLENFGNTCYCNSVLQVSPSLGMCCEYLLSTSLNLLKLNIIDQFRLLTSKLWN